jgi:hypothetical protein
MKSSTRFTTLDYASSPRVPKITWDRLRAMFGVIGRIALVGAFSCAAMMLWAARLPSPSGLLSMFGLLIGLATSGPWVASAAVEIVIVKWVGRPARRNAIVVLALTPVLLAMTWGLRASGLPCRLMFLANETAMDRWAQTFLATPGPPPAQARIGGYDAFAIEPIPGGVKFLVHGSGLFMSGGGFAYSPSGPPAPDQWADETFISIGGAWYVRTYAEK